jgi:DNA-binding transcriptional regulator LsrR (DeoR family)
MGFTQPEIAREMLLSVQTVGRLVKAARDQGILLPPHSPLDHGQIDDHVWDHLCDPDLIREVGRRLYPLGVDRVRLAPTDEADDEQTRLRVMRAAALVIGKVLQGVILAARRAPADGGAVVGFTGGTLLRHALDHAELPSGGATGATLVALSGDPAVLPTEFHYASAMQTSANGVVDKLASRLQLPSDAVWRFPLPDEWSPVPMPDAPSALRGLARSVPTVSAILGASAADDRGEPSGPEPLIERMGTIFAELQPPAGSNGSATLPEWAVGRINGHLIPRRGSKAAALACERRNGLAPGASLADLRRVAARVRPHYHAGEGVILLASGPAAADGVLALVTARTVNELIIDSETAGVLLRALKRPVHPEERESARAVG